MVALRLSRDMECELGERNWTLASSETLLLILVVLGAQYLQ